METRFPKGEKRTGQSPLFALVDACAAPRASIVDHDGSVVDEAMQRTFETVRTFFTAS